MKTKLLIILLFCTFTMQAENSLSISDTLITYGSVIELEIKGNIDIVANNIEIKLSYDANKIDIKDIISENGNIISEEFPQVIKYQNFADSSYIIIKSSAINADGKIFCTIKFSALITADTTCTIKPEYIKLDGDTIEATMKGSTIFITPPIVMSYNTGLGEPYPNPFVYETRIEITINQPSKLNMSVYNFNGIFCGEFPDDGNEIENEFDLIDEAKTLVNYKQNDILPIGRYYLIYRPRLDLQIGQGYYLLVFEINEKVFSKKIIIKN